MRRGFLIFLLAAGTVLGFGFAFARHCGFHHGYGYGPHAWGHDGYGPGRMALEDRAADACVRAAERVIRERDAKAPPAAPAPAPAPPAPPPAATP